MSGLEYVGDAKFKSADVKPEMTAEDWLDRAKEQATFARVAAHILNMTDEELERYARSLGETDDESALAAVQLAEWCQAWVANYEADVDVARGAAARMIVITERNCGREEMERGYRQN